MDMYNAAMGDVVAAALAGRLGPREIWVAIKGAEKYRRAMASGDVASEELADDRASRCWACPSSTSRTTSTAATGVYCGQPFAERTLTCGCLVAIRIEGKTFPGGKVRVASEQCPQGKW